MHISNIFSTFAADLGIVPSVIVNKFCNMKKVCIFRVFGGRDWYRVYSNFVLGVGTVYEVYCNRRHITGIWRFVDIDEALSMAIAMAKKDLYVIRDGEDIQ